jgi:hypothetical protein
MSAGWGRAFTRKALGNRLSILGKYFAPWLCLGLVGCATSKPHREAPTRQSLGLQSDANGLFDVCWREGATNRLQLQFLKDEVLFESEDKSVGRCVREIASLFPYEESRPSGETENSNR